VLEASAWTQDDGYLMAMRHRELPIESVQFHPESILTENGLRLITNFVEAHVSPPRGALA
jgi:anthranilate/para-aminobenzoate synthase component II